MVLKYSKNKLRGYEFSEILVAAVLFSPFCSPTKWCSFALSEGKVYHHSKY
jgi:hypothetical protein